MKNTILSRTVIPALVLLILALLIRIPNLNRIPHWSAGNENFLALEILEGARPLTNQNPHLGAFSPYMVALIYALFGVTPLVPRLIPLFFGTLTVLLTWRLGQRTVSSRAGLVAGTLMASAWYHVIFSSHFPWSNSLTPFFSTAFLLVLHRLTGAAAGGSPHSAAMSGVSATWRRETIESSFPEPAARNRTGLMLLGGLLFGLGMQTHPEMVTLLPVVVLMLALQARHAVRWLRSPAPWLLAAGGAIGYANMIYYNLVHRFQSVSFGLTYPEYALPKEYTATSVGANYWQEFLYLPRIVLGFYDDAVAWSEHARNPLLWVFWLLVIAGTVLQFKRRRYLVPAAFWSMFLIIPSLNSNYTLNLGRYLVFMFPPALILVAAAVDRIMALGMRSPSGDRIMAAGMKSPSGDRRSQVAGFLAHGVGILILMTLFLVPLRNIRQYYRQCELEGMTRDRYFQLAGLLGESGLENPLVILDQETGEALEFRHFIRESGYRCEMVKFRDNQGFPEKLETVFGQIAGVNEPGKYDGLLLVLSPWTRHAVLCELDGMRFIGQVDARFRGDIIDFYRVYEVGS